MISEKLQRQEMFRYYVQQPSFNSYSEVTSSGGAWFAAKRNQEKRTSYLGYRESNPGLMRLFHSLEVRVIDVTATPYPINRYGFRLVASQSLLRPFK